MNDGLWILGFVWIIIDDRSFAYLASYVRIDERVKSNYTDCTVFRNSRSS